MTKNIEKVFIDPTCLNYNYPISYNTNQALYK